MHAPGTRPAPEHREGGGVDEAVLLIHRSDAGVVHQRLQAVTDGRGQLLAIADSSGFITSGYAGSGYDQAAWLGAGLTSRAQTYQSRRWETSDDWACPAS